ncbi:MAG: hypothetical protein K6D59_10765 [Bacteroidales bacterium]|nr:hypothetical protein [Bacteroidales bacterium]
MKKRSILLILLLLPSLLFFSCSKVVTYKYLPSSQNMIKTVSFDDLNLDSKDYVVLDRVESSARIILTIKNGTFTLTDPDGTFSLEYLVLNGSLILSKYSGVLRSGFLSEFSEVNTKSPEELVRRMALYRLINLVREQGGDYVIEPIYTTSVEGSVDEHWRSSTTTITYLTTVSGKAIKLKTSK